MNMEPLDIYHGAEKCLNHTDNQQRDVMAAFPEAPAQARDEGARGSLCLRERLHSTFPSFLRRQLL
jgi:hypothetical protein